MVFLSVKRVSVLLWIHHTFASDNETITQETVN